jgi:hypothetical protein
MDAARSAPLSDAISAAIRRSGLSRLAFAAKVKITRQGLDKIIASGTASGRALARLRKFGGVRMTGAIIDSLDSLDTPRSPRPRAA